VNGLKKARTLESKEPSSALALYLQLKKSFPQSVQAEAGIKHVSSALLSR